MDNVTFHGYLVEDAIKYGQAAAAILNHIRYWVQHNQSNREHFHDGRYWTYSSRKSMAELFPYLSDNQIRAALEKLRDLGAILFGNYNPNPYDRSLWYALADIENQQIHLGNFANGSGNSRNSLYKNKEENKEDKEDASIDASFVSPALQEQQEPKAPKGKKTTLNAWIAKLQADELPIPADDPIYAWAEKQGVPDEWLALAWFVFKAKFTQDENHARKTYTDWRQAFRNYVKNDYLKLWGRDREGKLYLTTAGSNAATEFGGLMEEN